MDTFFKRHPSLKRCLDTFLKKYALDCAVFIIGGALSIVLNFALSNSAMIVGALATFFAESVLLALRKEAHNIVKENANNHIEHIAQDLQRLNIISEAISFTQKMKDEQYERAVEAELARVRKAFSELENGKRRIYKKEDLYNEQRVVIQASKSNLRTIHVVQKLEDLYRWDPSKMDKSSSFYSILYKTFEDLHTESLNDRRRIVILPEKSISEIIEFNNEIRSEDRENLLNSSPYDDQAMESKRRMVLCHDSIGRIVQNQENMKFKVKFITSARAISTQRPIFDCIISDDTCVFEFSKADSMDVHAYVINEQNYAREQISTFELLWCNAEEWNLGG